MYETKDVDVKAWALKKVEEASALKVEKVSHGVFAFY